jgi:hypothetical protein
MSLIRGFSFFSIFLVPLLNNIWSCFNFSVTLSNLYIMKATCFVPVFPFPFFIHPSLSFIVYDLIYSYVVCNVYGSCHTPGNIRLFALWFVLFVSSIKTHHVFPSFDPFLLVGMFSPYLKLHHDKQNKHH